MKLNVARVDVRVATLRDKPGALGKKLAALAEAGANLDFVLARRSPEKAGRGLVFVAPVKGARQGRAAKKAGFKKAKKLCAISVSGPDKVGMGAEIAAALGAADITLQGFSAHVIGAQCVIHMAFDSSADATLAARIIRKL